MTRAFPFDSPQGQQLFVTGADQRRMYDETLGSGVYEEFRFVRVSPNVFRVSGVAVVAGAFAPFDDFALDLTAAASASRFLVCRIDSINQDVTILTESLLRDGDVAIASLRQNDGIWEITPQSSTLEVIAGRIADGAVGTAQIADGAVTDAKVARGIERWHWLRSISTVTRSVRASAVNVALDGTGGQQLPSAALRRGTAGFHLEGNSQHSGRLAKIGGSMTATNNTSSAAVIRVGWRLSWSTIDFWVTEVTIPANSHVRIELPVTTHAMAPGRSAIMRAQRTSGSATIVLSWISGWAEAHIPAS